MLIWKTKLQNKLDCGDPELIVKADKNAGSQVCRDNVDNIQQKFAPIGSLQDSSLMVYQGQKSGTEPPTWYFYEMPNGQWDFTSDNTTINIDKSEYGTRKLKSINTKQSI